MAPSKIYFASPIEPSGASWLINCLLALGIRVDHAPGVARLWRGGPPDPSRLWVREGEAWRLHPRAEVLGKWLPVLVTQERFHFRDDIVVEYVQDFPTEQHAGETALLFLRDPRDAIYSLYRRRQVPIEFDTFCAQLNPQTLLPAPENWQLYARSWQPLVGGRVFTFEAYKRDAVALLSRILASLDLSYSAEDIARATRASDSKQARAAEAIYRAHHPGDVEVANRAGQVGDWRTRPELEGAIARITQSCGAVMAELGYDGVQPGGQGGPDPVAQMHFLNFYKAVLLPPEVAALRGLDPLSHPSLQQVTHVLHSLTEAQLAKSGLSPQHSRVMLASLAEFALAYGNALADRMKGLESAFSDGSAQHMAVLRDLLKRSRKAKPAPES